MKRIVFLWIISAAITSACTSTKWVRTTVAEQHEFNVSLEQKQEKGAVLQQNFAHPHQIRISDLEKLMGDLKYIEKSGLRRKEQQSPVFQAEEINRLAPVLALTLAKADASQRIRFVSFNQGDFLIFSVSRKTEGVLFIESAGRLNIAFNFINYNRQPSENTAVDPGFSSVDPLQIKTSETPLAATAPYAELHEFASGKPAPMWIVADLEKLKEAKSTATAPIVRATEEPPPAVAPAVAIDSEPVETTDPGQATEDMLQEDIRSKLKYLKELFDEGLISEKEYAAKKKELLDHIK